ncbi:hepatic lectin-like [Python bivittatus]|uniref:Hepatic lectin-like n=1 Tax=Python bivittatus TaxID=176946 RepID=A0A9F5MVA9_PYTBI|nr:hepatic lectin-like [Python bivittatus]
MDEEKFPDDFRTYKGGRSLIQRSFFPIYALLGISYLLILIGFVVALSKVSTISSELNKLTLNFSKDPFGRDFHLFPCGADTRQWEYFGGKCYFFSLKSIPWYEAKADCERKQSQLVIIDSLAKQNFIQTRTRNERFWIGLHDQHTEGEWKWVDGSNYRTGFKNWKVGEPNTYQGREEDCAQVWISGEWNDFICTSDSFYVCEKPLPSKSKAASKRT